MKKYLVLLFSLLLLLTASCGKSEESKKSAESKNEEKRETETSAPLDSAATEEAPVAPALPEETEKTEPIQQEHVHAFQVISTVEAQCTENGLRVYACACGEEKEEVLLSPPHEYVSRGCGNYTTCKHCGGRGTLNAHQFNKNTCTLCNFTVVSPVFVLNTEFSFDESADSIVQKLGEPTEILSEGELKSYVYASDLSRLTVIQTDSVGLWGVFTMDSSAFFCLEGKIVKAEGFTGKKDTQSDTLYREIGSCRVYGFRDGLGSGKYYGLWLRYTECEYHYLVDPRITKDYQTQARLSYYYVNALRAQNGLAPLNWSNQAAKVSYDYSNKMAAENFFNHDNLYGSRLSSAGVLWRSCGENISQGYANAFFVCDAYYNCTDHRNNILSTSFTHVGIGYALQRDGDYHISVLGAQTFYS